MQFINSTSRYYSITFLLILLSLADDIEVNTQVLKGKTSCTNIHGFTKEVEEETTEASKKHGVPKRPNILLEYSSCI